MTIRDTAPKRSTPLRAGTQYEVTFTDLLANGQAVGRTGGMVVFCFGPLPQERARVTIATVKQRYAVAKLDELLLASPQRAQPFCPVFGVCGGCQLQHLEYPAQLAWKREMLQGTLQRIGGFGDAEVRPTIGMDEPRNYRNKMSLVVDRGAHPPAVGFYQQRSHEVVPIDACPIVAPQLSAYIAYFNAARTAPATAGVFDDARHLVARSAGATNETVLTVTTAQPSPSVRHAAPALMAGLPGAVGVTNSYDLSSENAILGRRHQLLAGRAQIEEVIGGVRYRVSPGSFFQVNAEIVGRIFEFVLPLLTMPRKLVDLYCGAGTFSLFFAKHGCDVYGIEENAQAIAEADANARLNGLQERVAFRAGRVEDLVGTAQSQAALGQAGIVFLDPARKGCDEVTLGAIVAAHPPNVWYLSCDPATLARDLKFLAAKGYRLGIVQPFDMFPQTGHVETFVTLTATGAS